MIRKFGVTNLNGRLSVDLAFHDDLNLVTGRNGSGKTTVLKLLWYLISGNIERIPGEMMFDSAYVETTEYKLTLRMGQPRPSLFTFEWEFASNHSAYAETTGQTSLLLTEPSSDGVRIKGSATSLNDQIETVNDLVTRVGASLFFPTFRRIESGFSLIGESLRSRSNAGRAAFEIESHLTRFAHSISVRQHRLVTSVSTSDISSSLTSRYAGISEKLNEQHRSLSQQISTIMTRLESRQRSSDSEELAAVNGVLEKMNGLIKDHSDKQEELLRPFTALSSRIATVFQHKGIEFAPGVTLGEAKGAIASDKLSAGEKQMLSFLVYNAFAKDSMIFIDEPEISLHVDWQRQLFPTLLSQDTGNQFIIATHSPFIYSKFADKELVLDSDKGDGE